jgi:ADP-ribosylglycohydrolase
MTIDRDRVRGVLYGQAIGDSLGLPGEFKSKADLQVKYGGESEWPTDYEAVNRRGGREVWKAGEWSDDTEQALCILDSWLKEGGHLLHTALAREFVHWANTNGRGMGNHTRSVLLAEFYLTDPYRVSHGVWDGSGRKAAPNGAVMRTSVVGLLDPEDLDHTEKLAVEAAQLTHWDPRCVASAVAVSVTIAALVTGALFPQAVLEGLGRAKKYHPEVEKYARMDFPDLDLDEGLDDPAPHRTPRIGYTYKCLGAGFWALIQAQGEVLADHYGEKPVRPVPIFLDVLGRVIREGGDTDTNGAVAGSLLGAYLGAKGIPEHLINGLRNREELDRRLAGLEALTRETP